MTVTTRRVPRMRVLSVVSSSNQLYSGIGRNLFELARRLTDRVAFEFAIDDGNPRNTELLVRFGKEQHIPVHVGRSRVRDDALDMGNADLVPLLRQDRWDLVECVCWANAATNATVRDHIGARPLVYTPHNQPLWTVAMRPEQACFTEDTHHRIVQRADLVLCDSPRERFDLQGLDAERNHCHFLPIGCDFSVFRPGLEPLQRREQLLFIGDLVEPRKRFDRILDLFERLLRLRPALRLVVIGNRSEEARSLIPTHLRHACSLLGYVNERELQTACSESLALVLLSDFEAFGIPILESLAAGTPVFLSDLAETRSLFHTFRGACFCPVDDPEATFGVVARALERSEDLLKTTVAERRRLRATFDWESLAAKKWSLLSSCWFQRRCWAIPA